MELRKLELADNELTQSFCTTFVYWRNVRQCITAPEYMACLYLLALPAIRDIVRSTGMVNKETKERVLEDMHACLNIAGNDALDDLREEIRMKAREDDGASAEVANAEEAQEDNGYFEKFEDD